MKCLAIQRFLLHNFSAVLKSLKISNFLKQKSAEVGITENKENHSANTSPAQIEAEPSEEQIDKGYHKEGYVEPKKAELTEEEKAELA